MRSIHELMEEHERVDNALRAKFLDSVEGLDPVIEPEASTVAPTEEASAQDVEELEELDGPDIPENAVAPEETLPETPDFNPPAAEIADRQAGDDDVLGDEDAASRMERAEVELPDEVLEQPGTVGEATDTVSDIDVADEALPAIEDPVIPEESATDTPAISVPAVTTAALEELSPDDGVLPEFNDITPDESDSPELSRVSQPSVGFQGIRDLPDVTQQDLELEELKDPSVSQDERSERQMEMQMRSSDNLAAELAQELGPAFDEMREVQAQVVQDYVNEQMNVTWMLRAR